MATDFSSSRRVIEAKQIEENDGRLGLDGHVAFSERIKSQPRERFRAPKFVRTVTSEALCSELDEILEELWRLNEEYAGERTRIAEVAFCSDESFRHIRDRLMRWSKWFFNLRLSKENPKDSGDPCRKFARLAGEFEEVFSCLFLEATLSYPLAEYLESFVLWQLYVQTYKTNLERFVSRDDISSLVYPRRSFPESSLIIALEMGFLANGLIDMVGKIHQVVHSVDLDDIENLSCDAIRDELASTASDIQEMRPFLVHNFNPSKTLIQIGDGLTLAWDWSIRFGIANVVGADCERVAIEALTSKVTNLTVIVDQDGRLIDPCRPWSTGEFGYLKPTFGLAESLYVLRRFDKKLWGFYDQIDFDAIRRDGTERSRVEDSPDEMPEQVFALSCQDIAARQEPIPSKRNRERGRRIGMVQFKTLTGLLEKWFGCEFRQGNGSEVIVSRPGFKGYSLGHHVRNPEFPASTVRSLLGRLGISQTDWLRAFYGRV